MKRLILVWVMILCLTLSLFAVSPSEGLPTMPPTPSPANWTQFTQPPAPESGSMPTQPPTPPPAVPESTPRSIGLDEASSERHYGFPTAVDGYTFVSFADDPSLSIGAYGSDTLLMRVVCRYFEEVYPGCTLEQLKDFVILPVYSSRLVSREFSQKAGSEEEYWFNTMQFDHPYVYGVSFDVLLSVGYDCAFFTDPDPYMADRLERYQRATVRAEDAVELAWQEFDARREAAGYPALDEADRSDYLIDVSFLVSYNEGTTCWSVDFYEYQAPYNDVKHEGNIVFEAEFDAFTGETLYAQVFPDTLHGEFIQLVDEQSEKP
ncbi:MAG: hypothetical protein IKH77_08785 [Clostridia bacterium]|nr:hypothetical protein [Clostridia bacterium]